MEVLPDQLPWWVAGPLLGLLVVALFVISNQPLGASGAYIQTVKTIRRDTDSVSWRALYFVGIFLGGGLPPSSDQVSNFVAGTAPSTPQGGQKRPS